MLLPKNALSIFGLDIEDICCHSNGIDIAFKSMNSHLFNYFADLGFKLRQKNGYKVLALRRKPKDGILSVKEAYKLT